MVVLAYCSSLPRDYVSLYNSILPRDISLFGNINLLSVRFKHWSCFPSSALQRFTTLKIILCPIDKNYAD